MINDLAKQFEELAKPYQQNIIRKNPKGMDYVPVSEVIARLNYVLGPNNWDYAIVGEKEYGEVQTETGVYPKWMVAHVSVTARFCDGSVATRHGKGGQDVQFLRNNQGPVDIGDTAKGAVSDALKKASQSFGVALDLARTEEAMLAEVYAKLAGDPNEPKATEKVCRQIEAHVKAFPKDSKDRADFIAWWNKLTGDGSVGKKITSGTVSVKEADAALKFLGLTEEEEKVPANA